MARYEDDHGFLTCGSQGIPYCVPWSFNDTRMRCMTIGACVYHVWNARNRAIFIMRVQTLWNDYEDQDSHLSMYHNLNQNV